jgi:hypothetical protein
MQQIDKVRQGARDAKALCRLTHQTLHEHKRLSTRGGREQAQYEQNLRCTLWR